MQKKYYKIGIIITILTCVFCFPTTGTAISDETPDFSVIIGEWIRPDGGYIIRVRNIDPEGRIDLGYFNPHEINVSEANVSVQKGLLKLFIKLQDRGYPGSTYTLYYYAEKDALAGFYYQAAIKQKFEVVFIRKPNR